jgi:SpoIID/LytB domain protein
MAALRSSPLVRSSVMLAALAAVCAGALLLPAAARASDAVFTVNGRGWGHGIGMSQYGAKGYAEQGWDCGRIMAWYFQGTTLGTRSALTVKVDLDPTKDARSSWRLAAGSADSTLTVTDLYDAANGVEVTRGVSVWVTFSKGGAVLRADHYDSAAKKHSPAAAIRTFRGSVIASTGTISESKVKLLVSSGPYNDGDVVWRGTIRFVPVTTTGATSGHAINYVMMDQYVQGVVPRESPSGWHMEALKAQAIAARSYAYGAAAAGSTLYCTTSSQMYNGASCGDASHNVHETARTNQAVAETANEVVVYDSKVVQTFFSSSTGGRTANSKDVWFSSSSDIESPVYYTSVVDADSDSPYYRWPATDISGASLAGKLRSHYPSSSAVSPATVTKVTLKPGSSGFVRYVTIGWSNGTSSSIRGTEFQHALALKTSAFTVTLKTPPPAPTRFQQTDTRLLWAGSFKTYSSTALSGGSHKRTAVPGSSVTVTFKGTSVAWIGAKAPTFGRAEVSLDGTRQATVSLYASSWSYKRTIWSKAGLSADATHTLVIKVLGTHESAANGSDVSVDAFDVLGTLLQTPKPPVPPVWKRFEQTASAVRLSGTWMLKRQTALSGGSYRFTHSTAARAVFTSSGTAIRWIGKRGPTFGKAYVSVDGGRETLVDLYSARVYYRRVLWASPALPAGTHVVRIRPSGTHNAHATGHYVGVDAFDALTPVAP